ncbi:MAG: DUF2384 domain-containing protein [Saprospiraceae bacterium]|nr:MAG: hypothetical protein UZ09_BCD002000131 [Bacteroidetes bacterium OLB9]MCO6462822.1 DUF2384 domain-containing protein [Saprospiraceae bacterium]MCZ2336744.1 MbcA/ParS/Xre antitoxin family protein [Chitinophagales bacterium]
MRVYISERVLMLGHLYRRGCSVFGVLYLFQDWLKTPLPAFGHYKPISYLDTTFDFQLVEGELGRIEHGIFA